MATDKPVKQVVQTGAPSIVQRVNIYEQSWSEKVAIDHPDVDFPLVVKTIKDPCNITESKTRPGSYVFVNEIDVNEYGHQLRVPIKVYNQQVGTFKSAYFSAASSHGRIIWRRGDD